VPVFQLAYTLGGARRRVSVYPTLQFLYSHHIIAEYISSEVKDLLKAFDMQRPEASQAAFCANFMRRVEAAAAAEAPAAQASGDATPLDAQVLVSHVRQNPQYTLAAIEPGVYVIGIKDQLTAHDLPSNPLAERIQYLADECGFVLFDRSPGGAAKSVDQFGPYYVEQYLIMEALSKHEVAQNVLDYYVNHKEKLQRGLERYGETQGKGFICWRFIQEYRPHSARPSREGLMSPR
jgi:hypothetical protein